jgi:ADP-ribose pyrophosphatase
MTIEVIQTKTVFKGRAFDVRQDQVLLPNGHVIELDIVDHRDAVTIIPFDRDGQIFFIRQYRHAAGIELLELPAGVTEADEAPETGAQRELREETGMAANELRKIGGFYLAPGYSTEYMHVYLATGLYPSPLPGDESEFLTVEKMSVEKAYDLAESGQIHDSKTLVGLFLARQFFARQE